MPPERRGDARRARARPRDCHQHRAAVGGHQQAHPLAGARLHGRRGRAPRDRAASPRHGTRRRARGCGGLYREALSAVDRKRHRRLAGMAQDGRESMSLGAETTADEVIDGIDLKGKSALVTGASGGIGLEAARALASAGAAIVLAVRNAEKGDAAVATIRERVPDAQLELGSLDLTSLASVRSFADWFNASHESLDLLMNNAGVMASPFERTADGFELQFGTNHLGHFLLTALVMPVVLASAPARIVNVSSAGHHGSDIVWADINYEHRAYDKWDAYGQSKTANILFSVELERRFGARGVHAYALHPGGIVTELGRHLEADDFETLRKRAEAPGRELAKFKPG